MTDYFLTHPTVEELDAILGTSWAIARKTPANLARWARCLTPREYKLAVKEALARR